MASPRRRLNSPGFWASLAVIILLIAYAQVIVAIQPHPTGEKVNFSSFSNLADKGEVRRARILDQDSYIEGTYRRGETGRLRSFNTPYLRSETSRGDLVDLLSSNQIPF